MTTRLLRETNRDILRMTEEILRAAESAIDPQTLAGLRKKLAIATTCFFAEQERVLLRPLRESGAPGDAAIARTCVEKDLEGRQLGLAHYQRWTLRQIAEDAAGYSAAVIAMLRWMEARTLYAEQVAYPALARLISSPKRSTC